MSMDNERNYWIVEYGHERWDAETMDEVAEVLAALETLDKVEDGEPIEVRRMTHLDAALSEEEQESLDSWVEELGTASAGDELDEAEDSGPEFAFKGLEATEEVEYTEEAATSSLSEGDVAFDREQRGYVIVDDVMSHTADEFIVPDGSGRTVAEANKAYSPDSPVVAAHYVGGDVPAVYHFPAERLERRQR